MKTNKIVSYPALDVWAAACAAQRINGSYIKYVVSTGTRTNRDLVVEFLQNPTDLVTLQDREEAEKVRTYFQGLTFKVLAGTKLSEFQQSALKIAGKDVISSNYDISVITCLPESYERSTKRDEIDRTIRFADGGHVGTVGEKISATVKVLRSTYSMTWRTYYITGINDKSQVVFFSHNGTIDSGTVVKLTGTIKAHRDNSTQLNRVKVLSYEN